MDLADLTEEEYFAQLKLMFQTPGWQIFTAEVQDLAKTMNNIQDVSDEKDLWIRRGRLDQMGLILNYEETIRRVEEDKDDESPQ